MHLSMFRTVTQQLEYIEREERERERGRGERGGGRGEKKESQLHTVYIQHHQDS